jgi:hypothetical protein
MCFSNFFVVFSQFIKVLFLCLQPGKDKLQSFFWAQRPPIICWFVTADVVFFCGIFCYLL